MTEKGARPRLGRILRDRVERVGYTADELVPSHAATSTPYCRRQGYFTITFRPSYVSAFLNLDVNSCAQQIRDADNCDDALSYYGAHPSAWPHPLIPIAHRVDCQI